MEIELFVKVTKVNGGWKISADTSVSQEHDPKEGWCKDYHSVPQRIKECVAQVLATVKS